MNRLKSVSKPLMWLMALLLAAFVSGCSSGNGSPAAPTVSSTLPANAAIGIVLNPNITATFSEAMDSSTITATTFTLKKQGTTTAIPGALSFPSTTTATFKSTSNLAAGAIYTATLTTGVKDLAGNALAANNTWSFTTGVTADNIRPTVSSTVPASAATGAANASITATFSEAMDAATINTSTFTLMQGTTVVPGAVTYVGNIATFNPTSDLAAGTYAATVTIGAKDLAGNPLVAKTWTFTIGATADTTAPTVSTIPANADINVAINANITATFNEDMDAATITDKTFTLKQGNTVVTGVVTYAGTTATFNPTGNLLASTTLASTTYTATLTTGVKDLAGNPLAANKTWRFTTVLDSTPPTVSSTVPVDVATGIAINANITATFSEAMDAATINTATFTLKQGTTVVPGAVSYVGTTATFNPTGNLTANTAYTATLTTGVKDLAGNPLATTTWGFTTVATGALGPQPVDLGTAGNFVMLAKSGISTTGVTAVVGDIGVSPIDSTAITGFGLIADSTNTFSTSSLVAAPGKVYAADYTEPTPTNLTTAVLDMQTAFTDAAGRTLPDHTELGAGDISGMTLAPGLYKWGTGVLITNAGVTLSGGANDVWIFQIAQDLTVDNGAIVTLGGSAQAKNIFWQVSGQATLGTSAKFKGIILSQTLISLNTGAVLHGRALAQTAVTLNATTVGP